MTRSTDWLLALVGGVLLAVLIGFSSAMARHATPLLASWVTHAVGAAAALVLVAVAPRLLSRSGAAGRGADTMPAPAPVWAYFGGIPGALTVVLAAITVNSALSLAGTLALGLVGQILFGLACDHFGLFGVPKRRLAWADAVVVLFVAVGSGLVIFFRA